MRLVPVNDANHAGDPRLSDSRLVALSTVYSRLKFTGLRRHLFFNYKKIAMSKLQKIHGAAAGIDVGSCKFFVGTEESEVQNFDTFTSGCHELTEYLQQKNIPSVAMEATGV